MTDDLNHPAAYLRDLAARSLMMVGMGHDDHARLHAIANAIDPAGAGGPAKSFDEIDRWIGSGDPTASMLMQAHDRLAAAKPDVFGARMALHGAILAVGLVFTHQIPVPIQLDAGGEDKRHVRFTRPVVPGHPYRGKRQLDTYFTVDPADGSLTMVTDPTQASLFTREEVDAIKEKFPSDWTYYFGDERV